MNNMKKTQDLKFVGCTAVCGIIGTDPDRMKVPTLVVANVGDARAVLLRKSGKDKEFGVEHLKLNVESVVGCLKWY
jgi:serine/threonine protein phosphatase PrpC